MLVERQCLSLVVDPQVHLVLEILELMEVIHLFLLSLLQQSVVVKVDLEIMDLMQHLAKCLKVVHQVDQEVDEQLEIVHLLDVEQQIKVILVETQEVLLLQEMEVVVAVELELQEIHKVDLLVVLVVMV